MKRLWKPFILVVAASLLVTACAGGAATDNNGNGGNGNATQLEQSGLRVQGIKGQGSYGGDDPRTRSVVEGTLPGNGKQSPFPQNSIRPLNQNAAGGNAGNTGTQTRMQQQGTVIPYFNQGGQQYIAADALVQLLDFKNSTFDPATNEMQIGDADPILRLRANSKEAEFEENPVTLSTAPIMSGGKLMIPASAVMDLFREDMVFEANEQGLVVYPSDTDLDIIDMDLGAVEAEPEDASNDDALDFADDPNDPFAGDEDAEGVFLPDGSFLPEGEAVPALKNINMNSLIRTSKRYLGVKYRFGAGSYARTKRFDCSSYVRYVYGKYGIKLPRTSRAQARYGKTVSRKNLRKGDLLFFYVPGRFKSNRTVGHVGIYVGGGKMIDANTAPRNGVQYHNLNKRFWKRTFLKAKRVAY